MQFYRETEFKNTEIGEIPSDWEVKKISDISEDLISGGTPSTKIEIYWNGDIPWMTSEHINGRTVTKGQRNITKEGLENSASNLVPKENLLVATRVGIGKAALNKIDIAISQDLTGVIVKKEKSTPDYLFWFLVNNEIVLKSIAQGSTIKGILREDLGKFKVAIPRIEEQEGIAAILSRIDDTVKKTDEIIQKTQLLKKGLMQELLTRGIGHTEFKYSEELGCDIPKEWDVVRIEDIIPDRKGAIKIGPFGSQLKKNEMVPDGIKVYGQENVLGHDFTIGDRYISEAKFTTLQSVEIFPGDVLISMMGSIGYSVVFPENTEKGIMDSHLIRIQVIKDKCVPLFLARIINDAVVIKNQIKSMSQGAIMSGLNSQIIKRILLPLPGTKEQEEINSILVNVDDQIEKERRTREELERLKKGLMQILLTGKVRIKVN